MAEKTNKSGPQAQLSINIAALIIVLMLSAFAIYKMLPVNGSSPDTIRDAPKAALEPTAEMVEGVQVVRLSWGRLSYEPQQIVVKKDVPARIEADLKRLKGCYRSLIIPGLNVAGAFSEKKPYLDFFPQKAGTFTFSCTMNMARGTIIVTE